MEEGGIIKNRPKKTLTMTMTMNEVWQEALLNSDHEYMVHIYIWVWVGVVWCGVWNFRAYLAGLMKREEFPRLPPPHPSVPDRFRWGLVPSALLSFLSEKLCKNVSL